MKLIGVIPARYKSSRFPGKPLVDIFGKPMIYWVCKQVAKCEALKQFVVATDDQRVYGVCENYNLPVIMTSEKHINGTERVAEVARQLNADVFINVQGDEPMVSPATIDAVVNAFKDDADLEYAQAAKAIDNPADLEDKTVVKIVKDRQGWALYLSRSPIPYPRSKNKFKAYKHIGVYGFKKQFLFDFVSAGESYLESIEGIEQLRALENGKKLKIVEVGHDTISVDTPEDLDKIIKGHRSFFEGLKEGL